MAKRKQTVKALANDLHDVYDELRAGKLDRKVATSLVNTAGQIINAARVRLQYKSNNAISKIEELED